MCDSSNAPRDQESVENPAPESRKVNFVYKTYRDFVVWCGKSVGIVLVLTIILAAWAGDRYPDALAKTLIYLVTPTALLIPLVTTAFLAFGEKLPKILRNTKTKPYKGPAGWAILLALSVMGMLSSAVYRAAVDENESEYWIVLGITGAMLIVISMVGIARISMNILEHFLDVEDTDQETD